MQELRTTLRIRCRKGTFRRFKKAAADFDTYEETLVALLTAFETVSIKAKGKYA